MGKEIEIILRIATGVYGNDTLVLVLLAYHTLFPQRYYPILPEPHPQTSKHNRISCKKEEWLVNNETNMKGNEMTVYYKELAINDSIPI